MYGKKEGVDLNFSSCSVYLEEVDLGKNRYAA
jgi:hypothetical protein